MSYTILIEPFIFPEDALERVITIHEKQHGEDKLVLPLQLVGAGWASIFEAPVRCIAAECRLHTLLGIIQDLQVQVKADGESLSAVGLKGRAMKICQCFDPGLNPKSWAP